MRDHRVQGGRSTAPIGAAGSLIPSRGRQGRAGQGIHLDPAPAGFALAAPRNGGAVGANIPDAAPATAHAIRDDDIERSKFAPTLGKVFG